MIFFLLLDYILVFLNWRFRLLQGVVCQSLDNAHHLSDWENYYYLGVIGEGN